MNAKIASMVSSPKDGSLSADGTRFDSSQDEVLMRITDNIFWKKLEPHIEKLVSENYFMKTFMKETPASFAKRFVEAVTETKSHLFVYMPGICCPPWNESTQRAFRDISGEAEPWLNYVHIYIAGTTFSGNPVRTTLGNTLRQSLYWYYYMTQAGFDQPWLERPGTPKMCVAGDDMMMFGPKIALQKIADMAKRLCASSPAETGPLGLGQILKSCTIADWFEGEFCSKWIFWDGLDPKSLQMTRDYSKVLSSKQYYTGSNPLMRSKPSLHRMMILFALRSEKCSRLLEEHIEAIMHVYGWKPDVNAQERAILEELDSMKYGIKHKGEGYENEREVNDRIGISIGSLLSIYLEGKMRLDKLDLCLGGPRDLPLDMTFGEDI